MTAIMDVTDEIKHLYYNTSAKTILDDFARAIDLLKTLPDEASRERVAVYMEGLAEMRDEWRGRAGIGRGSQPGSHPTTAQRTRVGPGSKPAGGGKTATPGRNRR
jgi:hypothetical protein